VAYWADRYKHRSTFILLTVVVCMTGICLLAFANQNGVRYLGMWGVSLELWKALNDSVGAFLTSAGFSGCIPTVLAYVSSST